MCQGCYEEYGSPTVLSDDTVRAVELIGRVYDACMVGGGLHVVIDDWNLDDGHLDSAMSGEYVDLTGLERECAEVLRAMSRDERVTAMAIYDEFVTWEDVCHVA